MSRLVLGAAIMAAVACSGPADKDKDATDAVESIEDGTKPNTKVGEVDLETDSLSALKLSESVSPQVPASVTATGGGVEPVQNGQIAVATLTAAERKKSLEACNIRQKIKEAKANQESMAQQLCFFESQKGMKAGGKYRMRFTPPGAALTQAGQPQPPGGPGGPGDMPPGGPSGPGGAPGAPTGGPGDPGAGAPGGAPGGGGSEMNLSVFLDNSVADQFAVYICDADKLTQKIVVSSASEAGAQGSFLAKMEMSGATAQLKGAFDNGVGSSGHQRAVTQMSFDMKMGSSSTYVRSAIDLDLVQTGVSTVKSAVETSSEIGEFSDSYREIGAALIGPNLGSALFQRTIDSSHPAPTFEQEQLSLTAAQYVTTRSFFDNAGQVLAQSDSKSFADGGALAVADSLLPKLVADDFAVEFDSGDWDCSGAEDFTVEQNEAFKACMDKFASQFAMETCSDPAYLIGADVADAPSVIDQRDSAGAPELPPPPPPLGAPGSETPPAQ
jgi:hypothetical protein